MVAGAALAAPATETDARGHPVTLSHPARRIVSLAPHVTEIVFAAGAGDRLVGVSAWSDWPPQARSIPGIGDALRVNLERVLALAPDLVIGWRSGNSPADVGRLESFGIPVFLTEPARLADIPALLRAVGHLAGTDVAAGQSARDFERAVAQIRHAHAGSARVPTFVQIESQPLMTLGGRHLVNDVLAACGASNVFAARPDLAPTVGPEAVLAAAPRLVLVVDRLPDADEIVRRWQALLPASTRVQTVRADYLLRATPRVLEGVRDVCQAVDAVRGS